MIIRAFDERFWDPFEALGPMREELDRLLGGPAGTGVFPPMNLWVSETAAALTAELPGVHPENFDLSLEGETITLSGQRPAQAAGEDEQVLREERFSGRFERTLKLPFRVDAAKVQARFKNGVLTVTLPRAEEEKPRRIQVKAV